VNRRGHGPVLVPRATLVTRGHIVYGGYHLPGRGDILMHTDRVDGELKDSKLEYRIACVLLTTEVSTVCLETHRRKIGCWGGVHWGSSPLGV